MAHACCQSSCLCPVRHKIDSLSLPSSQSAVRENFSQAPSSPEPSKSCSHQDDTYPSSSVPIASSPTAAPTQPRARQFNNGNPLHTLHVLPSVPPSTERPPYRASATIPPHATITKFRALRLSFRETGFTAVETDSLLHALKKVQPIGEDESGTVCEQHNKKFPRARCSIDSLRMKFATMHQKKLPVGDPRMPPNVPGAEPLRYLRKERADMADADYALGIADSAVYSATLDKEANVEDFHGSTETEKLQDASPRNASLKKPSC